MVFPMILSTLITFSLGDHRGRFFAYSSDYYYVSRIDPAAVSIVVCVYVHVCIYSVVIVLQCDHYYV